MNKNQKIIAGLGILFVLIVAGAIYSNYKPKKTDNTSQASAGNDDILWSVSTDGFLYYPEERGEIEFARENYSETSTLAISRITFKSRNGNIYGFLILPKEVKNFLPAMVLLPGAGVSKESELDLAKNISELGIAVLTIDQRGVGETGGSVPQLNEDAALFRQGVEPTQHLMIYDALRAFDLLKSAPFIDSGHITMAGESMGGRTAIIATAIDKNIYGVLAISTAGYNYNGSLDPYVSAFGKSIDPDNYISSITPRKIVMIHNRHDKIIPFQNAARTYEKAEQPKRFALVNSTVCNHGYCDDMHPALMASLDFLYNQ